MSTVELETEKKPRRTKFQILIEKQEKLKEEAKKVAQDLRPLAKKESNQKKIMLGGLVICAEIPLEDPDYVLGILLCGKDAFDKDPNIQETWRKSAYKVRVKRSKEKHEKAAVIRDEAIKNDS